MAYPPTLPVEVPYSALELDFIDMEPPGLFPTNQSSYWGQMRKLAADYLTANGVDLFTRWYKNLDPRVVDINDIDEWEYATGTPQAPATFTIEQRRARVVSRLYRGPFIRAQRNKIIESFITPTFGASTAFDPSGIPLDAGGIPLLSGITSLLGSYRVYEDIRGFTYAIWIKNGITVDTVGLTRELQRITPAGIGFTIDNTQTDVLRYANLVMNSSPVGYWRLGTLADLSGYGNNLTANGGVVAGSLAAPGLLVNPPSGNEAATTFDGVNDYFSVAAPAAFVSPSQITLEGWMKLASFAPVNTHRMIVSQGNRFLSQYTDASGNHYISFAATVDGVTQFCTSPAPSLAINTTYHVAGTFDGMTLRTYLNGVLLGSLTPGGASALSADVTPISIGQFAGAHFMAGSIDEVAIYNCALAVSTLLDHYNTGRDIATY